MSTDTRDDRRDSPQRKMLVALIRTEARRQGVDPALALATVQVESHFNPRAAGDLQWSQLNGGARYRQNVLENPLLARNPARDDPHAWHSYGLFQLLAPYHVHGTEHPSVLYDPQVNVERGVTHLRRLAQQYGQTDPAQIRLAYTGALRADAAKQSAILEAFAKAYEYWANPAGGKVA